MLALKIAGGAGEAFRGESGFLGDLWWCGSARDPALSIR